MTNDTSNALTAIRATGRFAIRRQPSTSVDTCSLRGHYAATIFVTASRRQFHIRKSALDLQRFPNNDRLYRYARQHGRLTRWISDNAYVFDASHIAVVLRLL